MSILYIHVLVIMRFTSIMTCNFIQIVCLFHILLELFYICFSCKPATSFQNYTNAFLQNLTCQIKIWYFTIFESSFQTKYYLVFLSNFYFFYLTTDRNEGFNSIISSLNIDFLFTFWIFQFYYTILCIFLVVFIYFESRSLHFFLCIFLFCDNLLYFSYDDHISTIFNIW